MINLTLAEIKENNLRCVIKVNSKEEAVKLFKIFNSNGYDADYAYDYLMVNYWKGDGTVCFGVTGNKINGFDTETYYKKNEEQYGKTYRFKDLFAEGGVVTLKPRDKNDGISAKNGGKNSMKFTFYVTEGTRVDKSCNKLIPTMTTFITAESYGDSTYHGAATCDKADYSERDGILNAIANAVLGGNFDREYEKFLADKKRKYDESCKCKICGRNYYEDEKTGKRTPFTPEDARKHEEWHEQNRKNKREKYLIRKEAKRRLAEAEREGKIEQVMKELYTK